MNFRFVQYGGISYPDGIEPELVEVAGHLDKEKIEPHKNYSLHTEYSYGKRSFGSRLVSMYSALQEAKKDGVPQLWKSKEWSEQFADFILNLTEGLEAPIAIEIHPPFSDYCDLELFMDRYSVFEERIHNAYPDTEIVIENRAGTVYRGGRFIIGKASEIASLCKKINETKTSLGVVLDFPQLLTAENIKPEAFDHEKYDACIDLIYPYQDTIKGIHIWGKKKNANGRWIAHNGNLDTLFEDPEDKEAFISGIRKICSDGRVRFFVPEVNSGESDLRSVVKSVLN